MEGVPYKAGVRSLMYAMLATRADIASAVKYGEPIHIASRSTALDGRETHHEVFERHFELQIMPWRHG